MCLPGSTGSFDLPFINIQTQIIDGWLVIRLIHSSMQITWNRSTVVATEAGDHEYIKCQWVVVFEFFQECI